MAWETKDALATLSQAMKFESEGKAFYLKAAERTADSRGQTMFRSLAEDESEHYDKLKKIHDQLATAGTWAKKSEVISRQPARWQLPSVFDANKLTKTVPASADDVEALKLALKAETDSYHAYASSRDKVDDPDGKALFAYLAAEEMGHYNLLDKTLEYLNDTSSFFLIQEHAINEG